MCHSTPGARVEAEAARLVSLGATRLHTNAEEGLDHYGVALIDPEGNEVDIQLAVAERHPASCCEFVRRQRVLRLDYSGAVRVARNQGCPTRSCHDSPGSAAGRVGS